MDRWLDQLWFPRFLLPLDRMSLRLSGVVLSVLDEIEGHRPRHGATLAAQGNHGGDDARKSVYAYMGEPDKPARRPNEIPAPDATGDGDISRRPRRPEGQP